MTANEVLERCWDDNMPVNPISIARSLGVKVFRYDPPKENVVGDFTWMDGKPSIIYSPSGNKNRDRFTVAHELGHYCLGHHPSHRITPSRNIPSNYQEKSADRFAAQLLMPAEVVEFAVLGSTIKDITEMAKYFQVSYTAMRIRLQELGYL